jgi:hypothetical protein
MGRKFIMPILVSLAGVILVCMPLLTGCVPPEIVTAPPGETTPPPKGEQVIRDLASITIMVMNKNWDADAADDGITLDIWYDDSKGQSITFDDISITVVIELYGYREAADIFEDHEKMELVYQQQVTVDHSMKISEMSGNYIRIPFENIMVNQNKYYEAGTIKVTVETPEQGNFEAIQDFIELYTKD